jgi:hypothetical protein
MPSVLQATVVGQQATGGFPADRIIFINDIFFCWQASA